MDTESRDDRLAQLQAGIAVQAELLTASEGWQDWLRTAARFYNYSPNNVMLIMMQAPEATLVKGFQAWQEMGRHVNKGESAIWILAPITRKLAVDERGNARPLRRGEMPHGGEMVQHQLVGSKAVAVFDVSQTSGDPLPGWDARHPQLLQGKATPGLWDALAQQVHQAGFELHRADCSPANGTTDYISRVVTIQPGFTEAMAVKTLAHELAHVKMHDSDTGKKGLIDCRGIKEVEAESVAYLVLADAGMDSASYTVKYVTGWTEDVAGKSPAEVVKSTAERVLKTARQIIGTNDELMPAPIEPGVEQALQSRPGVIATQQLGTPATTAAPAPSQEPPHPVQPIQPGQQLSM